MTSTPSDQSPGSTEEVPPGSPVPGESAPVHDPETPEQVPPTSRQTDDDEADIPQGRVIDDGS